VGPGDVKPALGEAAKIKNIGIENLQDRVLKNLRDILKVSSAKDQ
jgi:hypothetical protein